MSLTSYERVYNTLHGKPIDQVACYDAPWDETTARWRAEGSLAADEDPRDALHMDLRTGGWISHIADLDTPPVVLEETDETILTRNGNGAILRMHKIHETTPEHVDFTVRSRADWEARIKPHLLHVDERRFDLAAYRAMRQQCQERQLFFASLCLAPFEQMHPVLGHEGLLMAMLEDPEWVEEMIATWVHFTIRHLEVLYAEGGKPDAAWFAEDLGFKGKPFMSPALYRELLQPGHKLLFDWAHSQGLKVIVHSCGFVEPLVPGLLAAGMDCLQALEVKAGMDVLRLHAQYGQHLAFIGNIDARALVSNDHAQIDDELDAKLVPMLRHGGRYILMSDHSIPPQVDFATMRYFFARGREMSREVIGGLGE
jgi:uroporphyrinogen decarboxylase